MGKAGARIVLGGASRGGNTSQKFRLFCLFASFLTLSIGLVHISNKLSTQCVSSETTSCFGPWLYWQKTGDGLADVNGQYWRTVFSFNTSVFFDLWTPIFLGLASLHMHIPALMDSSSAYEKDQWQFNCIFFIITALFGSFGYAGNLGVLGGFVNITAAVVCLVASNFE
ncbi:hypothetical protein TrVE_jg12291 [Triparma verrucosa]|uniref:Uncharacterized protein n=1 Tax=Triparma verrucosa TaxID=1606542 RepID=A0A9W7EV98_9STRA|nr:hypothetical protein TrVE_jg12291 [Triparma verrucosa]